MSDAMGPKRTDEGWRYGRILMVVDRQARDMALWFRAETAPEAYLQQELRRLHRVIEEGVIEEDPDDD